jgi:hypothetical protein
MDRLHYAGDSILTGTAIARALLEYAQALAQADTAATVQIPFVNEQGERGNSDILVGPASQLISNSVDVPYDEIEDPELVADLERRTANLRRFGTPETGSNVTAEPEPPLPGFSELDEI